MAGWLRKSEGTEGGREDERMKRHGGAAISEREATVIGGR